MVNPYTPYAQRPSRTGNPARDEQQANAARAIRRNMAKRPREEPEGVDASAARNVRSYRSRAASATENLESSEVGLLAMATVATAQASPAASPPGSDEEGCDEEGCDEDGCDEDEDELDQEAQVAMYHKSMMEENTPTPGRPKEVQYAKEMQRYYDWVADKQRVAGKCLTAAEYVLFRYDTAFKAKDPLSTGQLNMLLNAVNFALEEARKSETDPEKLAQHDEMKLRAHPHVKSLVANVSKAQGTRKRMKQAPVLQKHKDVLTREMIAKGAYTLMRKTAHRMRGRGSAHLSNQAHFLWVMGDQSLGRGGEFSQYIHPGGMFLYATGVSRTVGPAEPTCVMFTDNFNKYCRESKYNTYAHLFEATDEYVMNCGLMALFFVLVMNFELHDMSLLTEGIQYGWQHLPLIAGDKQKGGSLAHGKMMSSATHDTFFNEVKNILGLEGAAVRHIHRGGSTKRKGREVGNFTELKHDQRYRPDVHDLHYLQESASASFIASGCYGDLGMMASRRFDLAVHILRKTEVCVGQDVIPKDGGFFPKLRQQLAQLRSDDATTEHVRELNNLEKCLNAVEDAGVRSVAMLVAQVRAYHKDESSVPFFAKCEFDKEDLMSTIEQHPVISMESLLGNRAFEGLVKKMDEVWTKRGELRAKARQAATVMELTNMHQAVAHTDVMVSKLHVGVSKQEQVMEKMDKRFDAQEKRFDALEAKIVEACGLAFGRLLQNLGQVGDAMVGRRFDGTAVSPMPRTFARPHSASDETTAFEDPASPMPGNPAPSAPPGPSPPGPTPVAAAAVGTPRPVGSPRPGFLPPRSQICGPRDLWKAFDEGFGDFPPAFDTIRRQPDWTVKLLNSDVKYTYKAKRMLSYILRRKTAEGNVDTVLEELQNDFSAVNGGMVKWMKVKQSLFGDDVSAFTQRIAKPSASIRTHVVHQVPSTGQH